MQWIIITCNNSKKIVEAQKYLFHRYLDVDNHDFFYIDLADEPVGNWTHNIYKKMKLLGLSDYFVFGLDDYLPVKEINSSMILEAGNFLESVKGNRFELSWGASKKPGNFIEINEQILKYGPEVNYSVSCQFSIWKKEALFELLQTPMNPWQFETKLHLNEVYCYKSEYNCFRYIEESAISGRKPGKVNLSILSEGDRNELIKLGLVNPDDIVESWK